LLLANLVPLAGVLFWQWSVSSVIILYWFENVVIGIVNVARMVAVAPAESGVGTDVATMIHGAKFFVIPFFIFHYFFFCAGHGIFVFSLFPDENGFFPETNSIQLFSALSRAYEIFATPLALAAWALVLSHAISFGVNYLGGGEYRRLNIDRLMLMPYGRIVVLHITIIFGGFVTMALGEPIWVIVVLVLVKIGVDLKMHLTEHLKTAGELQIKQVHSD
jgi:hypothetical protein